MLEGMGNEGMEKGGMMEGCGGELEGVVGICCISLNGEGVWGSYRENGDSFVREVFLFMLMSVLLLRSLLMLLEVDEMGMCNCVD